MDPTKRSFSGPLTSPGAGEGECDEFASLTPGAVLTGTKERIGCSLVLLSQRAQCVVKPPLRAKSHQGLFLGLESPFDLILPCTVAVAHYGH